MKLHGTYSKYVGDRCRCVDCKLAASNARRRLRGKPTVTRDALYQLPVGPPPPGDWVLDAECAGMDTRFFFPEKGTTAEKVKEFCHDCPVERECLDYALTHRIDYGVWGGRSPRQRERLYAKWRAEAS